MLGNGGCHSNKSSRNWHRISLSLSIHLWKCPKLELFSGMALPSNLKTLLLHGFSMFIANRMSWNLHRPSSLQLLHLGGYEFEEATDSFPKEGLLSPSLWSLLLSSFKNLKGLNGKGFRHPHLPRKIGNMVLQRTECCNLIWSHKQFRFCWLVNLLFVFPLSQIAQWSRLL